MKNKKLFYILIVLIAVPFLVLLAVRFGPYIPIADFTSQEGCKLACGELGYGKGDCLWPMEGASWPGSEKIGSCQISKIIDYSKHCGRRGQCGCYCWSK